MFLQPERGDLSQRLLTTSPRLEFTELDYLAAHSAERQLLRRC